MANANKRASIEICFGFKMPFIMGLCLVCERTKLVNIKTPNSVKHSAQQIWCVRVNKRISTFRFFSCANLYCEKSAGQKVCEMR